MAVDIRNIANRNGIYYFRCRIPANLTNGQYREVKISLNTRYFDAHLFEIVEKANNYLRQVSLESLQKSGISSKDIVFEIRNRVSQYIKNILIEQELFLIRQLLVLAHMAKVFQRMNDNQLSGTFRTALFSLLQPLPIACDEGHNTISV